MQPKGSFNVFSGHPHTNIVTRNNIFDCPGTLTGRRTPLVPSDIDYDLFTGINFFREFERNSVGGRPAYIRSNKLEWYLAPTTTRIKWGRTTTVHDGKKLTVTDKVMTVPNRAIDAGIIIPGFNDDYKGKGPDVGAYEGGNPPIKFGRHVIEPVILAPWETQ